jgi:WD40 repeat protein
MRRYFQSICTASTDNTAWVWDLRGQLIANLTGHQGTIINPKFSTDGNYIATVSTDNTARVWDLCRQVVSELQPGDWEGVG